MRKESEVIFQSFAHKLQTYHGFGEIFFSKLHLEIQIITYPLAYIFRYSLISSPPIQ